MKAAILAVALAGLVAGALSFPRVVRIDADADWRAASQGLRRSPRPGILVAPADGLIHFHEVRGGIESVQVVVSARAGQGSNRVEVRRGEPMFQELDLTADPRTVVVPAEAGQPSDIDVSLWSRGESAVRGEDRVLVHEIVLRRGPTGGLFCVIPALSGLAVLWLLRREPPAWAGLFAVGVVLVVASAIAAALDPVSLLPLRPGTRAWMQAAAVAALGACAIVRASSRHVAAIAVAGTALILYAPTIRNGLVYDDYLWTRPWSLAEVAATFVGSEDPTGVSNSYYRPWASTSHAIDYWIWGFRPKAFHATNVALIVVAGLMAWSVFRRLPLTQGAALAGALLWIAHPMSASAVAWMSQRTDTLLAILYMGALWAFLAEPFGRKQAAITVALGVLALGAKELAVTLPIAMGGLLLCLPADEARVRRWKAVRVLALVVAAYAALWLTMFPEKLVTRTGAASGWGGFDPHAAGDWLRALPAAYGPLVLPTGYHHWWNTLLRGWSPVYLAAVLVVAVAVVAFAVHRAGATHRRLALFGAFWPLLVMLPLLGLRGIDLYRGGLMVALGLGWLGAVVAQRLNGRHPWLPAVALACVLLAFTPLTTAAAAAWGPGGFYRSMTQAFIRGMPSWLGSVEPHCLHHFWGQVSHDAHMAGE
jgi:hypothetical protein